MTPEALVFPGVEAVSALAQHTGSSPFWIGVLEWIRVEAPVRLGPAPASAPAGQVSRRVFHLMPSKGGYLILPLRDDRGVPSGKMVDGRGLLDALAALCRQDRKSVEPLGFPAEVQELDLPMRGWRWVPLIRADWLPCLLFRQRDWTGLAVEPGSWTIASNEPLFSLTSDQVAELLAPPAPRMEDCQAAWREWAAACGVSQEDLRNCRLELTAAACHVTVSNSLRQRLDPIVQRLPGRRLWLTAGQGTIRPVLPVTMHGLARTA